MNKYLNPFAVAAACIILLLIAGVAPADASHPAAPAEKKATPAHFIDIASATAFVRGYLPESIEWHHSTHKGEARATHVSLSSAAKLEKVPAIPAVDFLDHFFGGGKQPFAGILLKDGTPAKAQVTLFFPEFLTPRVLGGFTHDDKQKFDKLIANMVSVLIGVRDGLATDLPSLYLRHEENATTSVDKDAKTGLPQITADFEVDDAALKAIVTELLK